MILSLSQDLPILIEVVHTEEKVRGALSDLDAMLGDDLSTLEQVQVIALSGRSA